MDSPQQETIIDEDDGEQPTTLYSCPTCKAPFTAKYSRDVHYEATRSCLLPEDPCNTRGLPEQRYRCKLCGNPARRNGEYNKHNAQFGCQVEMKDDFEDMWKPNAEGASKLRRTTHLWLLIPVANQYPPFSLHNSIRLHLGKPNSTDRSGTRNGSRASRTSTAERSRASLSFR